MYISTLIFAAIMAMTSFVAATPPSCLLAAVMEQPNPADVKSLCGTLEPQMASNITASCSGSNLAPAIAAYSSTCLAQGVTISIATTTSTSSTSTGTFSSTTSTAAITGSGSGFTAGSTPTSTAATTSATGKSAASSVSIQSSGLLMSILLGYSFVGQYFL